MNSFSFFKQLTKASCFNPPGEETTDQSCELNVSPKIAFAQNLGFSFLKLFPFSSDLL